MEFAGSISLETVRQILKKTDSNHWKKKEWCLFKVSGEFVVRMDYVLDLYHWTLRPRASRGVTPQELQAVGRKREATHQSQARTGGTL